MDTETDFSWKTGLLIVIGAYLGIDLIFLIINLVKRSGPGGCSDDTIGGWFAYPGPLNLFAIEECDAGSAPGDCNELGRWKKYARSDPKKGHLCHSDINILWKDIVEQNIVKGYNTTELIAYIIVPTVTILALSYGVLAKNMNKSEWTFWIMIATIIVTGISSVTYNTDIATLPTQENSLEYVTSKLGLEKSDELEFSFVSRKQDGDQCMINGTVYGPSAAKLDSEPLTYTGECATKDFL